MRLNNLSDVEAFLSVVNSCNGDVVLTSKYGDKYNLKSRLSQYIAVGALLGEHGDELELWCMDKTDEPKFMEFFSEHKEVL